MFWLIFLIAILALSFICFVVAYPKVNTCYSVSCKLNNKKGKCMRAGGIDIYDNGIIGLCLWHTGNMEDRVIKPLKEKIGLDKITEKDIELIKDQMAVKSEKEFEKWAKRHGLT